jgi:methionine synthase II (cobalamin-independent)
MSSSREVLKALPSCASTGIGSLPHVDLEPALLLSLQQDIPFLPQLPNVQRGELMLPAALDGLPGLTLGGDGACVVNLDLWRAGRDRATLAIEEALAARALTAFEPRASVSCAFAPFLREIAARHLPFAKAQLAGPASVRWLTRTTDGRPASVIPELDQQIFRLLLAKGLALVQAIGRAGATPFIFLDEPGLGVLDPRDPQHLLILKELQLFVTTLQAAGAVVGVHCCGNTHWPSLLDLGLDVLSFDARLSLDAVLEDRDAWRRFVNSRATLAIGVVPTDPGARYQLADLCEAVEASLRATTPPGLAFEALLARTMLTPACGLGLATVQDAERALSEVRQAQERLRAVARQ